jgi:hypothetical protein
MTTNVLNSRPSANRADKRPEAQPLFERLEKSLVKYIVDATAAGVGLLALATPANADTISQSVRINVPLHHPAGVFGSDAQGTNWFSSHVHVHYSVLSMGLSSFRAAEFISASLGVMIGPLQKGARIGPGGSFVQRGILVEGGCFGNYCFNSGPWADVGQGYMGVVFDINGQPHFGWGLVSPNYDSVGVHSEAYNPVANQPILAGETTSIPEPATLGLLALGCFGLGLWRKRQAARRS